MRVHPVTVERAPLYLHLTYSLCLHAATLSFLISIPVFGGSGAPAGGEYVVTLAGQEDQTGRSDAVEMTDRKAEEGSGGVKPAGMRPAEKSPVTERAEDILGSGVAEENQPAEEGLADDNTLAEKANPVSVLSSIAAPPAEGQKPAPAEKPFVADVRSKPLPENTVRAAVNKDALHKVKVEEPPAQTEKPAAVKSTPPAAPTKQENPPIKPAVPEVLPDPEPESARVQPMVIAAKAAAVEPDGTPSPAEATSQVVERKMDPAKTAAKMQKKGDAASSHDAMGSSSESHAGNPGAKSHKAGKQMGVASAKKDEQAGNMNSVPGGLSADAGAPMKKGGTGGPSRSDGPPGAGGAGDGGTGSTAGTPPGAGKGYKFSAASPSRGYGLLRGAGAAGETILAGRERLPRNDMPQKKEDKATVAASPVAIRVPEEFLARDINIEVYAEGKDLSAISMVLARRAHPANRKKHAKDEERKIEEAETAAGNGGPGASASKFLTLRKAEKGVYIFSLANAGDAYPVTVVFRLFARTPKERIKEYKSLTLTPAVAAKFKFLMPEAVFWDDADRFSGSFEDSHSVTKFRYDTDLLWKEEKER